MAVKLGQPQTLKTGPWKGVFTTTDPFDDDPESLQDALNCYIADPAHGSGLFQRPCLHAITTSTMGAQKPTTIFTTPGGLVFVVLDGKIFRTSGFPLTLTDVTPGGVTIDNGSSTRVAVINYLGDLIVSDGVNRPWIGTNLSATPITGANIQIDTAANAWSAYGVPTVYSGVVVFIADTVPGGSAVKSRLGIVWCEPGQATVGYTQTGFTDFANIIQTSTAPLWAILGTNAALYYWRANEIGTASGIVDGSFASTATYASVSTEIGTTFPFAVQRYQNLIYFSDVFGRPQQLPIGSAVTEPQIWLQMRSPITDGSYTSAAAPTNGGFAGIVPDLGLYVCGTLEDATASPSVLNTLFVFDAKTGKYAGRWKVAAGRPIFGIGRSSTLFFLAAEYNTAAVDNRFWSMGLVAFPSATLPWIDGLTGGPATSQTVTITVNRLGYSADVVWDAGQTGALVTMNNAAVAITVTTPYTASTVEGTPTPATSADGTFRCVVGMDVHAARGIQITAQPTLGSTQWGAQQWSMVAVPSLAGPEEA